MSYSPDPCVTVLTSEQRKLQEGDSPTQAFSLISEAGQVSTHPLECRWLMMFVTSGHSRAQVDKLRHHRAKR